MTTRSGYPKPIAFRAALLLAVASAMVLLPAGCGESSGRDLREERDPLIQRALVKKRTRDVDGAIDLLNQALDKHPRYARPDLELGLLYHEEKEDFIRAIFHYQRYLAKRPRTEKKEIIQNLVVSARLSYAASLPLVPEGAMEEIRSLKDEVKVLRRTIRDLEIQNNRLRDVMAGKTGQERPGPGTSQTTGTNQPRREAPPPRVSSYVVQSGDTLTSIARKVYRDPGQWQRIYNANRGTMASPQSLNVGQTLTIPPLQPSEGTAP